MGQLSVEKFIGRACTMLMILFCLVTIIGYLELPLDGAKGATGRHASRLHLFIAPAVGLLVYILTGLTEKYIYLPAKRFDIKKAIVYYKSATRFIGVFKLLVLFSGIMITAGSIHSTLNASTGPDMESNVLVVLLIVVPFLLFMNEVLNVKRALVSKS